MNNYENPDLETTIGPDSICAKRWFQNAGYLTKTSAFALAIAGIAFAQEAPEAEEQIFSEEEDVKIPSYF